MLVAVHIWVGWIVAAVPTTVVSRLEAIASRVEAIATRQI